MSPLIDTGEWYKIRAPPGVSAADLVADLVDITKYMAEPTSEGDFGYQAAYNIHHQPLQQQQVAATMALMAHGTAIHQILTRKGHKYF